MQESSRFPNHQRPENLIQQLATRLRLQCLWDLSLIFLPPVAALIAAATMLLWMSWWSPVGAILVVTVAFGLAILAISLRLRARAPSLPAVARLADLTAEAQDRFLTLATVIPADQSVSFLAHLRRQTSGYLERIELKRDFPYRLKRSAYWSTGASLAAVLLLYLLLPAAQSARHPTTLPQRLREAARELAKKPELKTLADELQTLAAKLDDPRTSAEEKQALAQKFEQKIADQQKQEEQKDNRDLLGQAASALSGAEQQQSASGEEQKKQQAKGGGGLQTNAQQDGQGEAKQSPGGSGESKGESTAQMNPEMDQGKAAQDNSKTPGQDKNRPGEGKNNQPDPTQPDKDSQEKLGKTEGGSKEGAGKGQSAAEAPPQAGPPAERFYQPGEGKQGLKGAGYVTVQLPEDVIADAKGETRATKEAKGGRAKTQVPVSNVPLPAHVPNAPSEKQQMPIEYRGIIR